MLGLLINLMVAEKSGFQPADNGSSNGLQEFADRMAKQAMDSMEQAAKVSASGAEALEASVTTEGSRAVTNGPGIR